MDDTSDKPTNGTGDPLDTGDWVIIVSLSGKTYVGRLMNCPIAALEPLKKAVLSPAIELKEHDITLPVIGPDGRPVMGNDGRPALQVQRLPLVGFPSFGIHEHAIAVSVADYTPFTSLHDSDRNMHKGFVRQAMHQAEQQRLQQAGIKPATMSDLLNVGKAKPSA